MRERKGKFFIGTPMNSASKAGKVDNPFGSRPGIQSKSPMNQAQNEHTARPQLSKDTVEEELVIERQQRRKLEVELALMRDKKPLNYYEVMPGFRIKRWFVVVLLFQVLIWGPVYYWFGVLNNKWPENLGWGLLVACNLGPALWMSWIQKATGISYFDD